jgi:hypothetical protein
MPAVGELRGSLGFLHEGEEGQSKFPKANTCVCRLNLPTKHRSSNEFDEAMNFAIANAHGFGFA